ncbi:hypothetical protein [Ammoniphilus resinae]|uniref:Uncharacterized protein n=1 Tax=Ammoniphilus resinae TaxID=861532 RepID=A0ABS4GVY6_9BACL|nr:hypothetical protein [Ammoniphilus resinae]MBP1934427.1 hypothetical protein [Ammoniphilus resinae]
MRIRTKRIRINDYLDLYQYAKEIGDLDWQQDILSKLQNRDVLVKEQVEALLTAQLWGKFDEINTKLLEIYGKMNNTLISYEFDRLQDQVWELKQERVNVSQKLRGIE